MGVAAPVKRKLTSEKVSLIIASALMVVGMGGVVIASIYGNFILLLAFVELATVAMFFILFLSLIPFFFPEKVKASSIFYCGLGKEPYISDEDVYQPRVPLLGVNYTLNWDRYYDSCHVRVGPEEGRAEAQ